MRARKLITMAAGTLAAGLLLTGVADALSAVDGAPAYAATTQAAGHSYAHGDARTCRSYLRWRWVTDNGRRFGAWQLKRLDRRSVWADPVLAEDAGALVNVAPLIAGKWAPRQERRVLRVIHSASDVVAYDCNPDI